MKSVYPAIVHCDDDGFWIEFPDLEGCQTCGDTIEEAMASAEEALGLYLATKEEFNIDIPAPSDIKEIGTPEDVKTYVCADLNAYRRETKAVKKMVSIPEWLAKEADKNNLSLSKILQEALIKRVSV